MNKWLIALLACMLVLLAAVYVIIPKQAEISSIAFMGAAQAAVYRNMIKEDTWTKWWPQESSKDDPKATGSFNLNGYSFKAGTKQLDALEIVINSKNLSASSLFSMLPLSTDSMMVKWTTTFPTSANPFKRVTQYVQAQKVKHSMDLILGNLKTFSEKSEHLYGINIEHTKVTDTILVVIKKVQKEKPTEEDVYADINVLSRYISEEGATETNKPMLHISYTDDLKSYELMVAIPVNKPLLGNSAIQPKRMVPGNILKADVKGGEATVAEAMKQMENYVFDHQMLSPAQPYQLLITDRTKEKDTTKWITRIYYPIL